MITKYDKASESSDGQLLAGISYGAFAVMSFLAFYNYYEHHPGVNKSNFLIPGLLAFCSALSFGLAIAIRLARKVSLLARWTPSLIFLSGYIAYLVSQP